MAQQELNPFLEEHSNANFNGTPEFFMALPDGVVMHHWGVIFLIFTLNGKEIAWFDLELEDGYICQ